MRDAFGGIVNIATIVVFLVVVSGYMAYNVTYTKAFKVKNKIIDYVERYHKCIPGSDIDACNKAVKEYMRQIGYNYDSGINNSEYTKCDQGYCVRCRKISDTTYDTDKKCYYEVITAINVDVPIITKIMPSMKLFQVGGSSQSFDCPSPDDPTVRCN